MTTPALYVLFMLFCHVVSFVLSCWFIRKQEQRIALLANKLRKAEDVEFHLTKELNKARKNDGRDPKTGKFTGAAHG